MHLSSWRSAAIHSLFIFAACLCALPALAQQTLGSINGTVLDASGRAVPNATVTASEDQTGFTRTAKTLSSGSWQILDVPVGIYSVSVTKDGFETANFMHFAVEEAHPATINASLKPGSVTESVTVTANPLLNATDTTNGYTLDKAQIAATPLATGSFTQLAILAPGVSSQFIAGVGTNQGLGNQNIWANGQRATSNTMTLNGVDITNLFNGNTASEQTSQRYQFNIGEGNTTGGQSQDNIAVYGSNGNGLASPPPEFLNEITILTSMYDAQSGQTSGAHIGMITSSGTNALHGQVYGQRGTNWINADPFFYKQDVQLGTILPQYVNPELHKWVAGGTLGGPVIKNKLFFFLGYNHLYDSDQYGALSQFQVPYGLTSDRSLAGISAACTSYEAATVAISKKTPAACPAQSTWNSAAIGILQAKLPNGQFLIPSADAGAAGQLQSDEPDASLVSTSVFKGDQATASLDYSPSASDRLSAKYFYQHLPTVSPYADSNFSGFPEFEDNGAQVASLSNAINLGPHVNWTQVIGIARQKVYSNFSQALTASDVGITMPGGNFFPGIELVDFAQNNTESITSRLGPYSTGAFVDTGYFENRISPSSDLIWSHGKHTVTVGGNFSYDQLNIRNLDENHATMETKTFTNFLTGKLTSGTILEGNSNRYYRSHDIGGYGMDKWQVLPNVSITAGLRYDFDGPLSEKYGNLFNFDPKLYSATDSTITNSGFIVAGNNKQFGTPGISNSTLTGRQWGLGPRLGVAWAPKFNDGKVVWRAGAGTYYDRGQYFQYLSPPAGAGISGPFGVTEEAPFAAYTGFNGNLADPFTSIVAPTTPANIASLMPTIDSMEATCTAYNIYNGNDLNKFNCNDGEPDGPLVIGNYNRANKLPYTEDWTLDFQWQPTNTMSVDLGYVGNRGKHQVIPLPFNESVLCTPGNYQTISACHGQQYSYSVQVLSTVNAPAGYYGAGNTKTTPYAEANEPYDTFSGGNVDMRVPFPGFDPNSASFTASGVSAFDALEAHLEKQMSHDIQAGVSYTWSHTLDEQSDVGLFFTGDNPDNLRGSYADADFDETQNLTFNFVAKVPDAVKNKGNFLHYLTNNWSFLGIVVLESGEPYSIYDYSGTAGGQYFGTNAEIINPILPLKPGIRPTSAKTGKSGAFTSESPSGAVYSPALNANDFEIPLVAAGANGVPPCDTTTAGGNAGPGGGPLCDVYETTFVPGQRNIFRQSPQKRADITIQKDVLFKERFDVNYQFEVFNITNTPSFDIPDNDITLNPSFSELNANENGTQVQPTASTSVTTPTGAAGCSGSSTNCAYELYTVPGASSNKLGVVTNTIGSSRIVEMSMHFTF